MIRKILFTALIIFAVLLFYKFKKHLQLKSRKTQHYQDPINIKKNNKPILIIYAILGFIVVFSSLSWIFKLVDNNQVIQINVRHSNNTNSTYFTYKKNFKERTFITTNNRHIQLSNTDQIEVIYPD